MSISFLESVATLFFGKHCASCGTLISLGNGELCSDCSHDFEKNQIPPDGEEASIVSLYWFRGRVRYALHRFKYRNQRLFGIFAARLLAMRLSQAEIDLVVCVPASELKDGRRYHQAVYLARRLAKELKLPFVSDALTKLKGIPSQVTRKSSEERQKNAASAFRKGPSVFAVQDRRVLLVDDLVTSGSTLSTCRNILMAHGARSVLCCTVACRFFHKARRRTDYRFRNPKA